MRFVSYLSAMLLYKIKISSFLKVSYKTISLYCNEINKSLLMKEIIIKKCIKKNIFDLSMVCKLRAPALYVLCRIIRPVTIVETGVAEGFSSSFILQALENSQNGHLYSIDLPNQPGEELSEGKYTGWLVPEELKNRWSLMLGSSKEKLPLLLEGLKCIDIFYHDSEHSYQNMLFEFKTVWKYVKIGGFLCVDDITENNAFDEFSREVNCKKIKLFKLGIIKKIG